nr:MAG TPA: hypothetical protein [Caudoviricetes sp.]
MQSTPNIKRIANAALKELQARRKSTKKPSALPMRLSSRRKEVSHA